MQSSSCNFNGQQLDLRYLSRTFCRFFFTLSSLGRRIALGSNGIAQTTQLITNLIVGNKNATEGIEAPRFYLLDNSTIAVEGGTLVPETNLMLKSVNL